MNATADKLIFRSVPNKRYTVSDAGVQLNPDKQKKTSVPAFDGYCYILFGESADGANGSVVGGESDKHHAVVESINEGFKKAIIYSLSHIA